MNLALHHYQGAATTPPPDDLESAYQAHHAMVYRTAYRVTGNPSDAEDVLQTVFLRLMKREPGSARAQPRSNNLKGICAGRLSTRRSIC